MNFTVCELPFSAANTLPEKWAGSLLQCSACVQGWQRVRQLTQSCLSEHFSRPLLQPPTTRASNRKGEQGRDGKQSEANAEACGGCWCSGRAACRGLVRQGTVPPAFVSAKCVRVLRDSGGHEKDFTRGTILERLEGSTKHVVGEVSPLSATVR